MNIQINFSTTIKIFLFFLTFVFLEKVSAQHLFLKMARVKTPESASITAVTLSPVPTPPPVAAAPTFTSFSPAAVGSGGNVTINGTNFGSTTTVTFNGTPAAAVSVRSSTEIIATVGTGASGIISVTNPGYPAATQPNFEFALPPTITGVAHNRSGSGTTITLTGSNFIAPATISLNDGRTAIAAVVVSSTSIVVTVPSTPILYDVTLNTPGGTVTYSASTSAQANADLNLPDFGNGLTLVPTPSFASSQIYQGSEWGFSEGIWGNSLGIDSNLQKLGSKFLYPQTSTFGLKLEVDKRITSHSANFSMAIPFECNFLVKKVSYFDTASKISTNFNPFVIHTRLGLTSSFIQNNVYLSFYWNTLSVVGSNAQFTSFFKTGSKNVLNYPEFDLGGLINLGNSGNQAIKIDLSLLINNGDANFITQSTDVIIPYLKIGFVTTL